MMDRSGTRARYAVMVLGAALLLSCSAPSSSEERISAVLGACFPYEVAPVLPPDAVRYRRDLADRGEDDGLLTAAAFDCLELAAARGSCALARGCLAHVTVDRVPSCTGVARCDGTTAIQCHVTSMPPYRAVFDCAARGEVCVEIGGRGGQPTCVPGVCAEDSFNVCTDDAHFEWCYGGALWRSSCPAGTTCRDDGTCAAEACSASTCDGSIARPCDIGAGWGQAPFDCAVYGQACRDGVCIPNGTECSIFSTPTQCEGDVLVRCSVDGFLRRFDCVANGFASCDEYRCRAMDE